MQARGWIEDREGEEAAPPASSVERAERFQPEGEVELEGGRDAQPTPTRSYWWRVFRVPVLTKVMRAQPRKGRTGSSRTFRMPTVSDRISETSRADFTLRAALEPESGLRPVGLPPFRPTMTAAIMSVETSEMHGS